MQDTKHIRRGWRETVEPGIYRAHRLACPSSTDQKPKRRCNCPFQMKVPGYAPGTTRIVTVAGTVGEARAERRRLMAEGRPEPSGGQGEHEQLVLRELARMWFRTRAAVLAPNTIADADVDFRLRIEPALGHLELSHVSRHVVEEFLANLIASGANRRMVIGTISTLRRILAAGVEWGHIPANTASRLRLPAPETHAHPAAERVLDHDGLAQLIRACKTLRVGTMVRVLAEAGLRRGEIIGLRWPDIDLQNRRLHVRRTVYQVRGERGERTTKGRRSRKVAITEDLSTQLAEWYIESVVEEGGDAAGYVWPGKGGGPMNAHTPNQALARALKRAGLTDP